MRFFLNEAVDIFPKLIVVNGYDFDIDDDCLVSFLKSDIWICKYEGDFEDIYQNYASQMGLFVNLDYFVGLCEETSDPVTVIEYVTDKMSRVKGYKLFLTGSFSRDLVESFIKDKGIVYIENWTLPVSQNIAEYLKADFNKCFSDQEIKRTSLRINFDNYRFKAFVRIGECVSEGVLKNISYKGMSISLTDDKILSRLNLGVFVSVDIDFVILNFKVSKAIIARKNNHTADISISYDIEDNYMIDEKNNAVLTAIIDSWLFKIVKDRLLLIEDKAAN